RRTLITGSYAGSLPKYLPLPNLRASEKLVRPSTPPRTELNASYSAIHPMTQTLAQHPFNAPGPQMADLRQRIRHSLCTYPAPQRETGQAIVQNCADTRPPDRSAGDRPDDVKRFPPMCSAAACLFKSPANPSR